MDFTVRRLPTLRQKHSYLSGRVYQYFDSRDALFRQLGGIYERWIDDIESLVVPAQKRGDMVAAPPRLVAFTLSALIGDIVHRRTVTDDGVSAAEAADFVVSLVMQGLRPDGAAPVA
jgi:AcrR family transcriptional regulator